VTFYGAVDDDGEDAVLGDDGGEALALFDAVLDDGEVGACGG